MGNKSVKSDKIDNTESLKDALQEVNENSPTMLIKNHNLNTLPSILKESIADHQNYLKVMEVTYCSVSDKCLEMLLSAPQLRFSSLRRLNLEGNELTLLEVSNAVFPQLEFLGAKQNRIQRVSFKGMITLQTIDLESNSLKNFIEAVDELTALTSLSSLYLANNQLQSLPKELGSLPKMHYLDVASNNTLLHIPPEIHLNASLCLVTDLPHKIIDGLYLGPVDPVMSGQDVLKALKITHVLSVSYFNALFHDVYMICKELPLKFNDKLMENKFIHKRVDIDDEPSVKIADHFESCVEFIENGRKNSAVYVHCWQGVSRSASVVIAYVMTSLHMSYEECYQLVKQARPKIRPNPSFIAQLRQFEQSMITQGQAEDVIVV